MSQSDLIVSLSDGFHNAALTGKGWSEALERLASATGSPCSELIGFDDRGVMFHWVVGMSEDGLAALEAINGHDPRINSRVRIGGKAPILSVMTEADFDTAADMTADPGYRAWIEDHGTRFLCLAPLWRDQNRLVGLSVARTPTEGNVDREAHDLFARVAPHVRAAARTMMALGDRAAGVLAESLGGIEIAAFVCDGDGRVHAASAPADMLVETNRWLMVRRNHLHACAERDRLRLAAAIQRAATTHDAAPPHGLVLSSHPSGERMLLEITRLPGETMMRSGRVLIVAHPPKTVTPRIESHAQLLFDLTATEASVVGKLMTGQPAAAIALERGVSIGTIRTHIRHIFEKTGASSQIELVAKLTAYF
jgi:DNA-binding CsgD family transcriptional regulator